MSNREKRRLEAKARKREEAKRRQEAAAGGNVVVPGRNAPVPIAPTAIPPELSKIVQQYPTPEALQSIGPLIVATWSVPPALAQALTAAGQAVPPPISGHMLLDTGASSTCIAADVAKDLALKPVHFQNTYGAGGLHQLPVYRAQLQLVIQEPGGSMVVMATQQDVAAIPELRNSLAKLGVQANGAPVRLIGLLGRDFMRHTTVVYNGTKGSIEVRIEPATLHPTKVVI